jgi:hemolysin III
MLPVRTPPVYSHAELRSDAVVHIAGILAALIAAPVLVILSVVWIGDAGTVSATLVYAICLVAMLVCSALYNTISPPGRKDLFRRIDQSAIYLKIAGTYTPFAVLTGAHAGPLLAGVWGAALAGAALVIFGPAGIRRPSVVLYLALGWAGAAVGGPLIEGLSGEGLALIVTGGVLYTAGILFLLWERLPHHNTIWHVFVLAATAILYVAVIVELRRGADLFTATAQAAQPFS